MGSNKKNAGKKRPFKPPGSGKKSSKDDEHKQRAVITESSYLAAVETEKPQAEDVKSDCGGECEQKSQIHDACSRPGDHGENLSSRNAHSRRRSYSPPRKSAVDDETQTDEHNTNTTTRTQAVTILRRRTLSRLSEFDRPSEDLLRQFLITSPQPSTPVEPNTEGIPDTMYETANLMDYVDKKLPKKTNKNKGKNKNKNQDGKSAVSEDLLSTEEQVKAGGSSTSKEQEHIDLPLRGKDVSLEPKSNYDEAEEKESVIHQPIKPELEPNVEPCAVTEDEGKEVALEPKSTDTEADEKKSVIHEPVEPVESVDAPSVASKDKNNDVSLGLKSADDEADEKTSVIHEPAEATKHVAEPSVITEDEGKDASLEPKSTDEEVDAKKSVIYEPVEPTDPDAEPCVIPEDQDKAKGKQRLDSIENELNEDATQLELPAQPSSPKSSDTEKAVATIPKTPELIAVKDIKPAPSPSSKKSSAKKRNKSKNKKKKKKKKKELPAITEGQVQEDVTESSTVHASSPKSIDTTSSSWTLASNQTTQQTPQTTAPSTGNRNKSGNVVAAQGPSSTTGQASVTPRATPSSHAHPTRLRSLAVLKTTKPPGFFWQLDSHGFPCAKGSCTARCNLWDCVSKICPGCGPYSETRYCSRAHLLQDIKAHWLVCGKSVFTHPCRDSTIPRDVREAAPLIPCKHDYDTPERFRQAVHFNMDSAKGDYFIFSDWEDMLEKGFPDDDAKLRCSSRVLYVVRFEDAEERDRFRRVLAAVLFVTIETPQLTDYLYRLIRDTIRLPTGESISDPSNLHSLEASLKYQMYREFAITIQPSILLGSFAAGAHRALVQGLESQYWILRAARVSHPTVENAVSRMKGEGWGEDVAEEDRRVFCRGDGWDGAGAGEMEI